MGSKEFFLAFSLNIKCFKTNFRGEKAKITLWGELAHYLSEDVIGKHTVLIVTSTMVEASKFKGKLINFVIYYNAP